MPYLGGMSEREPMLSDKTARFILADHGMDWRFSHRQVVIYIRDHYERLIDEGKLRVVEEVYDTCLDVDPYGYEVLFKCSACSSESGERGHNFCPNCGGKIKRA